MARKSNSKIKSRREPLPWVRLFFALVIASISFTLLFLLAYSISYLNYQGINEQNNLISGYLEDLDFYLDDVSCDDEILYEASERLDRVGSRISILEDRFGKDDERVLDQKKLYTDLEVKHFGIIKVLNERCDEDFVSVLFFYSNSEADDMGERSESMGYILSAFKQDNPERVMVYSFDYDLDSGTIDGLKEKYGLTGSPIAVVNEEESVYVRNIDDLEVYL